MIADVLSRPPVQHEPLSQRTSVSSGEVWTVDLRPLVQVPAEWFNAVVERAVALYQSDLVGAVPVKVLVGILADPVWADAPQPFVSSTDSGGISAEFETPTIHVSIDAEPGGDLAAYVAVRGESDWEGLLRDLPDGLEKWAWRLGVAKHEPI